MDNAVKMIAIARKSEEITGEDVEKFDEELNEMCAKWHGKFADMSAVQFAEYMLMDMLEAGFSLEEIIEEKE